MRTLFAIIGAIGLVGGILFILAGFTYPGGFDLEGASAPQIAQIYSQSTYVLAQGISLLVIALLCAVLGAQRQSTNAQAAQVTGQNAGPNSGTDLSPSAQVAPVTPGELEETEDEASLRVRQWINM